jgi:hypothetical protein
MPGRSLRLPRASPKRIEVSVARPSAIADRRLISSMVSSLAETCAHAHKRNSTPGMTNCQINLAQARDGFDVGADGSEPPTAALTSRVIARGSVIFRPSTAAFGKFSMRVPAHSAGFRNGVVGEPVTPPVQLPCRARPPMRKLPGDSHSSFARGTHRPWRDWGKPQGWRDACLAKVRFGSTAPIG